jgi:hypothetical protein
MLGRSLSWEKSVWVMRARTIWLSGHELGANIAWRIHVVFFNYFNYRCFPPSRPSTKWTFDLYILHPASFNPDWNTQVGIEDRGKLSQADPSPSLSNYSLSYSPKTARESLCNWLTEHLRISKNASNLITLIPHTVLLPRQQLPSTTIPRAARSV